VKLWARVRCLVFLTHGVELYRVSKTDADVAYYNFDAHGTSTGFVNFFGRERSFVLSPRLTNVSALPGEIQKRRNRAFQMLCSHLLLDFFNIADLQLI